ncbi:hypothetical protein [Sporomusa aerivorans]|uniref:hypothetical protein n=1 Tax=Sporomusa aerivorans TaxID=204936 RepID=UPI00352B7C19
MSLIKEARNYIISKFEENPRMSKEELKDLIRPHYIADYPKLVDQDINRIVNYIIARIRDENGVRQAFVIDDSGEKAVVHIDKSNDLRDIKTVYSSLVKDRDGRERSIAKVRKRGQEVAGQMALIFDDAL